MPDTFYKNEHVEMWVEDGILYHKYSPKLVITLSIAIEITRQRILMSEGKKFPLLVDARLLNYISKDAREYWSVGEGIAYLSAGAFVIGNSIHKIFGNMFLTVNRPPLPAKLFTEVSAGVQWLQKFKENNTSYRSSNNSLFIYSSSL